MPSRRPSANKYASHTIKNPAKGIPTPANGGNVNDMNDINFVINGTFVLLGVYMIILAFRAKFTGFVHQILMLDRRMVWSQCRDQKGYIGYIFPRITGCGLLLTAAGAYSILASGNAALQFTYYQMAVMIAIMAVCICYMTVIQNAGKKFY